MRQLLFERCRECGNLGDDGSLGLVQRETFNGLLFDAKLLSGEASRPASTAWQSTTRFATVTTGAAFAQGSAVASLACRQVKLRRRTGSAQLEDF
jgi:hypothetical protein